MNKKSPSFKKDKHSANHNKHIRAGKGSTRTGKFQLEPLIAEGLSGVSEFVLHRPGLIKEIVVKNDLDSKAQGFLSRHWNGKIVQMEDWEVTSKEVPIPKTSLFATVTVPLRDEKWLSKELVNMNEEDSSKSVPPVVLLDHVQDPRNFGAIIRSAAFFGVKYLVVPKARQAPVTNVVLSTAQGGLAHVNLVAVPNLVRVMEKLKEHGFWALGADMAGEPAASLKGFYDRTVLVLGNEGSGLSALVRRKCDRIIGIPSGAVGVESLNVSVAAGILLYSLV